METSNAEVLLGISRSSDGTNTNITTLRMQVARQTGYSLMGAGLCGINSVGLEVTASTSGTYYVMPRFTCGLEALVLSPVEGRTLQDFHRNSLHMLQHLSRFIAKPISYLLLSSPSLEAQLHINIITFFTGVLRRSNSIEQAVIHRQLMMKNAKSNSWV